MGEAQGLDRRAGGGRRLLLVAGCQHIPYYDEVLNWFSWSEYDPEVKAIEAEIPPPGSSEAPPAPDDRAAFVRDGRGGYVQSDPPPGVAVSLGATPVVSGSAPARPAMPASPTARAAARADPGSPLVGIRNSVGGRSPGEAPAARRGTMRARRRLCGRSRLHGDASNQTARVQSTRE